MPADTIAPPTAAAPPSVPSPMANVKMPSQVTIRPQSTIIDGHEPEAPKKTVKNDAFSKLDAIAAKKTDAKPTSDEKIKPPVAEKPKPSPKEFNDVDTKASEGKPAVSTDNEADDAGEATGDIESESKPDAKPDTKPVEGEKKKPNPWRLADEWKKKAEQAIRERDEMRKNPPTDPEKTALADKIATQEKREKELVDELKFYNYEKHDDEFKKLYDEPYKAQWVAAVEEISQFPVSLADGTTRAGNQEDLLRLVNLPPVEARELAEQMFGKYANDVLRERKLVKEKFDARTRQLDAARKGLGEVQKQKQAQLETSQKQLKETVDKVWESSKKLATEHQTYGEYFKPIEGDQEGNLRLAKGYELVERAFAEDAADPTLTPDKRADIIKRHAIVYHRAAAFGRVLSKFKAEQAKVSKLEKELAAFKSSEPGEGEGRVANGKPAPVTGLAGAWADLERRAR